MQEFRDQGVTLVFVSHAMELVRELCTKAAYLDRGRLVAFGPTDGVAARYEADTGVAKADETA